MRHGGAVGDNSTVSETGTQDNLTIALGSQPTGNVVIDLTSEDTGEFTVSPTQVTFTTGNWNTTQTLTVTGVNDSIADGTQQVQLRSSINTGLTADSTYDALSNVSKPIVTFDDDTAGFTLAQSGGSTAVAESGSTDSFTVVLNSQPTGDVVFSVTSSDTGEATVSPSALTFTTGNWNSAQTVTVTGVNDSIDDGNVNSTTTIAINTGSTADSTYDSVSSQTVTVTTADDDTAGFTVTQSGGSTSVTEAGSTDTFTVVLNTQPTGDVVFALTCLLYTSDAADE